MDTPFITRGAEALTLSTAPTESMTFLVEGNDEMPDVAVERMAPGDGSPLHSHPWAEWGVVIRGRIRIRMGDDEHEVGPGDLTFVPADMVHTFMAVGDDEAEVVSFMWPGGFHKLYTALDAAFAAEDEPDFGTLAAICAEHGSTLHGPPLAVLEASQG